MKTIYTIALVLLTVSLMQAKEREDKKSGKKSSTKALAEGCAPATSQADLNINNVRARILGSGDMWWDLNEPQYEVPKGSNKHSMFAGALWLGGVDEAENLRLAAMTYRQDGVDYWPGPLTENAASITAETCQRYNQHWIVYRDEVEVHAEWVRCKEDPACDPQERFPNYTIPESIQEWPGNGIDNELPNKLAPYFETDNGAAGIYEPEFDYPAYDIEGDVDCQRKEADLLYGDQTIWWVYNDKGNTHTESQAASLGFEIRAQAFAFTSNDEVNNMTFNNYRILNKSTFRLTDTYFGTWFDPDLGNAFDDIIGCDIARGLGYCYNADNDDEGARGYGLNPPAVGFDFFQGPFADYFDGVDNDRDGCIDGVRNDAGICETENRATGLNERIIMSGFMYYNNGGGPIGPPGSDPDVGQEFYNYLRSTWKNGNDLIIESPAGQGNSNNGDGYVPGNTGTKTRFAYPGNSIDTTGAYPPTQPQNWYESPTNNADKRGLHCAGPFSLAPGALNFITTGTVWARNFQSTDLFASVDQVIVADDKAQQLFDNCFNVLDGPDSPQLEIVELDKELILNLKNAFTSSTIGYEEVDPAIPPQSDWVGNPQKLDSAMQAGYFSYRFEGFQIFQVANPNVSVEDIYDRSQARLIWQSDVQNDVGQLINYDVNPTFQNGALEPQDMTIIANNEGIELSFSVTEDAFAEGNPRLVNNKEYYFYVIAYAQNEYIETDPRDLGKTSQKQPYLAGRDIGNAQKPYLGIPSERPSVVVNAEHGQGLPISRYDGAGNSGNFERLTDESRENIMRNGKVNKVDYLPNFGPLNVEVIDPSNVQPGDFELRFDGVDPDSKWTLYNDETGEALDSSNFGLGFLGEQLLDDYGISITTRNVQKPGFDSLQLRDNGLVGAEITYSDASKTWLAGVPDDDRYEPTNWILAGIASVGADNNPVGVNYNDIQEGDLSPDPFGQFETILNGTWAPFSLTSDVSPTNDPPPMAIAPNISKQFPYNQTLTLGNTMNIDIVITKDQDKWTRVPVFELGDNPQANEHNVEKFRLRGDQSMEIINGQLRPSGDASNTGWSYFPGYAVNTQTGRRLHMAFGENSWLKSENGGDMLWNPTSDIFRKLGTYGLGGMHVVYVFRDSAKFRLGGTEELTYLPNMRDDKSNHPLFDEINDLQSPISRDDFYSSIAWAGFPLVSSEEYEFTTYDEIPSDALIELRVDRPYQRTESSGPNDGYPMYGFSTRAYQSDLFDTETEKDALELVGVVPNPYYGFSQYEDTQIDNVVKIINLPIECTINIFMTNGTLVRTIEKDNDLTYVEWDLTNDYNVPISSGIYLIHVDAGEAGQKVLKWMGAMRPIDLDAF